MITMGNYKELISRIKNTLNRMQLEQWAKDLYRKFTEQELQSLCKHPKFLVSEKNSKLKY
jgi:hypothetical protein